TLTSVSLPSAAIVTSRSTVAPSAGVASGGFASTNFATRGGSSAVAGAAASGVCANARGAATPLVSSASALATSVHLFDRVPGISASAGSHQPKSCQRASPRNCGASWADSLRGRSARYSCPRGHVTAVRCGWKGGIPRRGSGGTPAATPASDEHDGDGKDRTARPARAGSAARLRLTAAYAQST